MIVYGSEFSLSTVRVLVIKASWQAPLCSDPSRWPLWLLILLSVLPSYCDDSSQLNVKSQNSETWNDISVITHLLNYRTGIQTQAGFAYKAHATFCFLKIPQNHPELYRRMKTFEGWDTRKAARLSHLDNHRRESSLIDQKPWGVSG